MKVCPQCKEEYAIEVDFCPSDGTKLRTHRGETEDPLLGMALDGRWIIEEKLGEGGMGAVYRGHQKSVNRTVAIKTLRPQLVDSDEFVDRFFREARIAATISHPNSVTILDYGESSDGTLYLAMEFLDGELLTDRIDEGTLTIKQVLEIAIQVSSALSAAHDNSIVHRDLKPDNIFLLDVPGGATFVKVLDFGIAKMLDSKTQVTKTGMIFGTPEYMSPEQCRGDKIDGRSDLYSLGCILYELVGGRTPFRATTPMAVLMAHVNQAAPSLAEGGTGSHIPFEVEQIIMRLLEKNPDDRFADADELRTTVENVLHALENPGSTASQELVRPVPSREIVADAVNIGFDNTVGIDSTDQTPAVETDERRERNETDAIVAPRSKAPIAVLVVLLVAIVGVGGVVASMLGPETSTADVATDTIEAQPIAAAADNTPPVIAEAEAEPKPALELENVPEPEPEPAAAPEPEPEPEPEPAEKRPKKKRPQKKAEPKPKPEPAAKPAPKEEPKVAKAPEPKPKPKPAPKKEEKKKKKKKGPFNKLGDNIKKESDRIGKEVEDSYDNVMDGLMN